MLPDSAVQQNMHVQRMDLAADMTASTQGCTLIGYWPMNRLISGPWPWQGSLVSCTSHLAEPQKNSAQLHLAFSCLPLGRHVHWVGKLHGYNSKQEYQLLKLEDQTAKQFILFSCHPCPTHHHHMLMPRSMSSYSSIIPTSKFHNHAQQLNILAGHWTIKHGDRIKDCSIGNGTVIICEYENQTLKLLLW